MRAGVPIVVFAGALTVGIPSSDATAGERAQDDAVNREPVSLPADPFADGPALEELGGKMPRPKPRLQARLRGRVRVMGRADPVPRASLVFEPDGKRIRSDDQGRFEAMVPAGKHVVLVRAPGFDPLETEIHLTADQDLEMEFRLLEDLGTGAYRTVVTEKRAVAISSTTLRDAEIHQAPGSMGDPLRVVASLPGVAPIAGFLPYVVVRGAAPGNTGYYLDGARVPILFHLALGPSVIHPYFIDAVDFYPSGAPVRLGRHVSGIIEARTRPARRDRVHGDFEVRLTDAGGLLEIPFHRPKVAGCKVRRGHRCRQGAARGALTVGGRYSYTAGVLTLVQSNAEIAFWDYQARLDHRLGARADWTAFGYGSFDSVGQKPYVDPSTGERIDPPPFARFQFHRIDNRIRHRLPREGDASYALILGLDQTDVNSDFARNDGPKLFEWRIAPRIDFRMPVATDFTLSFGFDQEFQIFRLGRELTSFADDGNVENLGFFFHERFVSASGIYFDVAWTKGRLEARPGIRTDLYTQVGASPYVPSARGVTRAVGVDPRLLLREQVAHRVALKQAIGMYHQPPSTPIPIPGLESFGFERGLQRNVQGSFGYDLELILGKLTVSQEAYVGWLSNLQDYDLARSSDDPIEEVEDVLTDVTGWAWGLETMLRLDPTLRIFGWAAYTLSWSRRDFPAGGHAPSNWDQRHILNVVVGYKIGHKWNVGGRVHYHTGRPWTAPVEGQTYTDALIFNRNNARLPAFFQLDLRVERDWTFKRWQLQGVIEILNATYSREVFACDVEDGGLFSTIEGQLRAAMLMPRQGIAQCSPLGFRYVIPSLGLRARF